MSTTFFILGMFTGAVSILVLEILKLQALFAPLVDMLNLIFRIVP